jgi:hypothetical protein
MGMAAGPAPRTTMVFMPDMLSRVLDISMWLK